MPAVCARLIQVPTTFPVAFVLLSMLYSENRNKEMDRLRGLPLLATTKPHSLLELILAPLKPRYLKYEYRLKSSHQCGITLLLQWA